MRSIISLIIVVSFVVVFFLSFCFIPYSDIIFGFFVNLGSGIAGDFGLKWQILSSIFWSMILGFALIILVLWDREDTNSLP